MTGRSNGQPKELRGVAENSSPLKFGISNARAFAGIHPPLA
jgi:hypothetical protein